MVKRICRVVAILAFGLLGLQSARQADDSPYLSRSTAPYPVQSPGFQPAAPQAIRAEPIDQQPVYFSLPSQSQVSPVAFRADPGPAVPPQYTVPEASWSAPVPPPAVAPSIAVGQPAAGVPPQVTQTADGTWSDDGRYVIININGQEMRLLKSTSEPAQSGQGSPAPIGNQTALTAQPSQPTFPVDNGIVWLPPAEPETIGRGSLPASSSAAVQSADGTVRGRLLQKGHPLVNCYVVIVPVPKDEKADASIITREPLTTTTNEEGVYLFEHVPAGEYKLIWLPNGSKQWIRRIAMRPDVIVHQGQDVTLKDIRMAQQTIN